MTPNDFRRLALKLPEATEGEHMGHADFRLGKRIFASLGPPGEDWAMVKLPPELQSTFVKSESSVFLPFSGAWGKQGCTKIILAKATEPSVRQALQAAWLKLAPKRLAREHGDLDT